MGIFIDMPVFMRKTMIHHYHPTLFKAGDVFNQWTGIHIVYCVKTSSSAFCYTAALLYPCLDPNPFDVKYLSLNMDIGLRTF